MDDRNITLVIVACWSAERSHGHAAAGDALGRGGEANGDTARAVHINAVHGAVAIDVTRDDAARRSGDALAYIAHAEATARAIAVCDAGGWHGLRLLDACPIDAPLFTNVHLRLNTETPYAGAFAEELLKLALIYAAINSALPLTECGCFAGLTAHIEDLAAIGIGAPATLISTAIAVVIYVIAAYLTSTRAERRIFVIAIDWTAAAAFNRGTVVIAVGALRPSFRERKWENEEYCGTQNQQSPLHTHFLALAYLIVSLWKRI